MSEKQPQFLTTEGVDYAFNLVKPTALQFLEEHKPDGTIYFVVIAPDARIIGEFCLGQSDDSKWLHNFDDIAYAKASLAHRSGRDTRHVRPTQLVKGDTPHIGGVNFQGLAIGVSGVASHFDEMFATMLGTAITAVCHQAFEDWKKANPKADFF